MAMVAKLGGELPYHLIKSVKGKPPMTYCGIEFSDKTAIHSSDRDDDYGSATECQACVEAQRERSKRFVEEWAAWERRNPEKARAANEEMERG